MEQDHLLDLWRKSTTGDSKSFEKLYHLTIKPLFSYGLSISGDREITKDAIQELFINLWKKKDEIVISRSVQAYLFTSLRRILLKSKQDKFSIVPLHLEAHDSSNEQSHFEAEALEFQKNRVMKVKNAFEKLPRRQREVMYLKYMDRLDYEEIAEVMSLQMSAVYKLVSKAVKRLKGEFQ